MSKTVNRGELLKQLESVTPGLSSREIIEQSSCFVFQHGKVVTFNGDVACWTPCVLKITGAVQGKSLLDCLRLLPEDTLNVSADEENKLVFYGKGHRRTRLTRESKVTLPIKNIKEPKVWKTLPADFLEAVDLVHRCCGSDQEKMETFVHIALTAVEALGESRIGHFKTKLPIIKDVIVHKDSIKHVVGLGMTEIGLTSKYVHFRNASGVTLSCLRWTGEDTYPSTQAALNIKGHRINLPRGLDAAVERANVFSRENVEDDEVLITLSPGKVRVEGTGITGDHREERKIQYTGSPLVFMISPKLLSDLCRQHTEAWVTEDTLTVKSGKFTFVTGLTTLEENSSKNKEQEEDSSDGE